MKISVQTDEFTSPSHEGNVSIWVIATTPRGVLRPILFRDALPVEIDSEPGRGTCFDVFFPQPDSVPADAGESATKRRA